MTPEEFRLELEQQGIHLSDKQMQQFDLYYNLLVEWNGKMNLTAITDKKEVYLKHFYDSVTPLFSETVQKMPVKLCDIGAGAGFPSLPMKIIYPELQITIVDSLNKRITFLKQLTEKLGLEGVLLCHDRAETFGQISENRESYDLVTARAVARLSVLAELCLPLVKKNGYFIALKASSSQKEVKEAQKAIATLGGKLEKEVDFVLPISRDPRHVLFIQKKKETPKKYPRKPGIPNKTPIV